MFLIYEVGFHAERIESFQVMKNNLEAAQLSTLQSSQHRLLSFEER